MFDEIMKFFRINKIQDYRIIRTQKQVMTYKQVFGVSSETSKIIENDFVIYSFHSTVYTLNIDNAKIPLESVLKLSKKYLNTVPWIEKDKSEPPKVSQIENLEPDYFKEKTFLLFSKELVKRLRAQLDFNFNIVLEYKSLSQQLFRPDCKRNQNYRQFDVSLINSDHFSKLITVKNCYDLNSLTWDLLNKSRFSHKTAVRPYKPAGPVIIKAEAFSKILDSIARQFHADLIYQKQSFLQVQDIGNRTFQSDFDLISIPYKSIVFDSEGCLIQKKYLVRQGKVADILSNRIYSGYLGYPSFGNAELSAPQQIDHQRLVFLSNQKTDHCQSNVTILNFSQTYSNNAGRGFLSGKAEYMENGMEYCSDIDIEIEKLFHELYGISGTEKWDNHIFCSDVSCSL